VKVDGRPYWNEGRIYLDGIDRILADGGGADRQRRAHASDGISGVLRMLVAETAG